MKIIRPVEVTDTTLIRSNAPTATDPPEYDPNTSYTAGDTVSVPDTHQIYEALTSVTGTYPPEGALADPPTWLEVGTMNQWAMFNGRIAPATVSDEPFFEGDGAGIQVEIKSGRIIDALAFFEPYGTSIRVEMIDQVAGTVYDQTKNLSLNAGVTNWWRYFFTPTDIRGDVVFTGLPAYSGALIRISIFANVGEARCGLAVLGWQYEIGCTVYGTSVGILDFSRKERDTFGRPIIVPRDTAKRANYDVRIPTPQVDGVRRTLDKYTTQPLVWIGSESYESTIVYGYFRELDIVLATYPISECTIDVEGLI